MFTTIRAPTMFDGLYESKIINEGLITSYNVEKLKKTLLKKFENNIEVNLPKKDLKFYNNHFDYHAYTFTIRDKTNNKDFKKELQKILDLFGYIIALTGYDKIKDTDLYSISPKYPIKVNEIIEYFKIKQFYHITHQSNIDKILKIGLKPRPGETIFHHPGNRIYLVGGASEGIKDLAERLAENKKLPVNQFKILKIEYNKKYEYFLDDTATALYSGVFAVWVLKNISPKEIQIIDKDDQKILLKYG